MFFGSSFPTPRTFVVVFPSMPTVPFTPRFTHLAQQIHLTNGRPFQEPPACHLFIQLLLSHQPTSGMPFALARDVVG